jgi:hypothetical protein
VLLEKEGEDQLHQTCEKLYISKDQGGKEHPAYNKMKEG